MQDMRKVHPLYLFDPYFIDGLKSRPTVQGVGPLWHHKHLTDAYPRLVEGQAKCQFELAFFCLEAVNRRQNTTK